MRQNRPLLVVLICVGLYIPSALAEQEVAVLVRHEAQNPTRLGESGSPGSAENRCGYNPPAGDSCLFVVYTKQEIDAKRAADAKAIAELQDTVAMLRRNLKELTEINDALTKRLDQMEKTFAARP
jgi:uncharacterized coiled-coil protein SlyX